MRRIGNRETVDAISERREFETHTGSMRGAQRVGYYAGHLPSKYRESFERATYVVYSYATPIGWLLEDGWVVPHVRYSVTTSKHQGHLRLGVHYSNLGYSAEQEPEPSYRKTTRKPASTGGMWAGA